MAVDNGPPTFWLPKLRNKLGTGPGIRRRLYALPIPYWIVLLGVLARSRYSRSLPRSCPACSASGSDPSLTRLGNRRHGIVDGN